MLMKTSVRLDGLHPVMRHVKHVAEHTFREVAAREAIITSGLDGEHSPGSFHPAGMALDFRTRDLSKVQMYDVLEKMRTRLKAFDVVVERSHLHVEVGPDLAKRLGATP
jgi:hypothetical protein